MKRDSASFTLVELLVVVGFIVLFSSITISYYSQFAEENKLKNSSKKITSLLDFMRVRSTSGDSTMCRDPVHPTGTQVSYFSFTVDDDKTYSVNPVCLTGTPAPVHYTTETNIVFPTVPLTPYPVITFFPVTGGSSCSYVYIKNTVLNKCRYVKTSDSGLVKEDACTACNACPATCP